MFKVTWWVKFQLQGNSRWTDKQLCPSMGVFVKILVQRSTGLNSFVKQFEIATPLLHLRPLTPVQSFPKGKSLLPIHPSY